ncbi:hypothetical protein BN1051_00632 [Arthrobacter saudimassiliensis]|uniref:DUF1648 domain-containing protein n=1 Tax=Arthrobacter saudimassiliensis TaxID=1461584 RepID=A0A078MM01_9MICC|nr:hypothetical protein BN1051_00632 [Arthrobacter saudimassiliensis]
MSADTASARRRFLLVAVAVPAVVVAAALALQLAALGSLPDPVAVHWGGQGPDGFGPAWLPVLLTAVFGALVPALMVLSALPGLRDGGVSYRFLGALVPGFTVLLCMVLTWGQLMQAGLADARQAPGIGFPLLASTAAGLAVAALPWAVWFREASLALPGLLLILGAVTAALAGTVIAWLWAEAALAWVLTAVTLVLLAAAATTTAFRVRVDGQGLTVTSVAGVPRFHIAPDDVASAEAVTVNPMGEFGGWGLRSAPGRFGVVLRTGEALQVRRRNGRQFVVTVDDAGTAAALLQALARRG